MGGSGIIGGNEGGDDGIGGGEGGADGTGGGDEGGRLYTLAVMWSCLVETTD